jgi:copper/silver efflux system protein
MWSHGTGAEVMQRIAVPMIGGMVSSTLLTLIVIPAIYAVVKGIAVRSPRLAPLSGIREARLRCSAQGTRRCNPRAFTYECRVK